MSTSLFDLKGKVALVMDATKGLGRAMVSRSGADLILVDRNGDGARKAAALIETFVWGICRGLLAPVGLYAS